MSTKIILGYRDEYVGQTIRRFRAPDSKREKKNGRYPAGGAAPLVYSYGLHMGTTAATRRQWRQQRPRCNNRDPGRVPLNQ